MRSCRTFPDQPCGANSVASDGSLFSRKSQRDALCQEEWLGMLEDLGAIFPHQIGRKMSCPIFTMQPHFEMFKLLHRIRPSQNGSARIAFWKGVFILHTDTHPGLVLSSCRYTAQCLPIDPSSKSYCFISSSAGPKMCSAPIRISAPSTKTHQNPFFNFRRICMTQTTRAVYGLSVIS